MYIVNHRKLDTIYEIIINQLIQFFTMVVIAILDFTYNWYYKHVQNMAHTELINACQSL